MTLTNARKGFLTVVCLLALALTWPGYTLFSSATPLILGFPPSFLWIIGCVIAGFVALVLLYQHDKKQNNT